FTETYSLPWESNQSLGGFSREDLRQLDTSKPLPEGLDLVAETILRSAFYDANNYDSSTEYQSAANAFHYEIASELAATKRALDSLPSDGPYPSEAGYLSFVLVA